MPARAHTHARARVRSVQSFEAPHWVVEVSRTVVPRSTESARMFGVEEIIAPGAAEEPPVRLDMTQMRAERENVRVVRARAQRPPGVRVYMTSCVFVCVCAGGIGRPERRTAALNARNRARCAN